MNAIPTLTAALHDARRPENIVLRAEGLSKAFGAVTALRDVSLTLRRGEIRALCGENGAGKSSLTNLLTGVHRPDSGSIEIGGQRVAFRSPRDAQRLGIALVAQELSICPDLSIVDNIWLGSVDAPWLHRRDGLRGRAAEVLERVGFGGIALDTPASRLTLGERQLVELARMLTREAQILLLDEPTATLSDREIERMSTALRTLRDEGRSILYISHRLNEVFQLCDAVTVLRNGRLAGTRPVAELDRNGLIEMMLGRPHDNTPPTPGFISDDEKLVVERLHVPTLVDDFAVTVPRGGVVCIAGQLGSGADSVIKAIAGLDYTASGSISVDGTSLRIGSPQRALNANVMYVSGDRRADGIFCDLSVVNNLIATRLREHSVLGVLRWRTLRRSARALTARVHAKVPGQRALASTLSGGNQQKLAFGRCIDRGARRFGHERAYPRHRRGRSRGALSVDSRFVCRRLRRTACLHGPRGSACARRYGHHDVSRQARELLSTQRGVDAGHRRRYHSSITQLGNSTR